MYYFLINTPFVGAQTDFSFANQYDFYTNTNQQTMPTQVYIEAPKTQGVTLSDAAQEQPNQLENNQFLEKKEREKRIQNKEKSFEKDDDDYKPYEKASGKSKKSKQKVDRNIIPNTVHHILAFIQKKFKSGKIVQNIFRKQNENQQWTQNRFYIFQKILKSKVNHYVNQNALKIVTVPGQLDFSEYSEEEQEFYCKISRILIRYFLKYQAISLILQSKKIKRENISEHLKTQRFLLEKIKFQRNF